MDMSQYLGLFISETREHLRMMNEAIVALEQEPGDREQIDSLFRQAHSIKGMAASMEYGTVADLAHKMEDLMDRFRKGNAPFGPRAADLLLEGADLLDAMVADIEQGGMGELDAAPLIARIAGYPGEEQPAAGDDQGPAPEAPPEENSESSQKEPEPASRGGKKSDGGTPSSSIRVRTHLLDQLVTITGELVTTRHRFAAIAAEVDSPRFGEAFTDLSRLLRELHDRVLQVRMMPVSGVMDRFPRLVRDLGKKNGKDVTLVVEGKEIELDRGILEELGDPLLHVLRNAVDHGIETPAERRTAGKPEKGRITIRVRQEKDQVVIGISDDGRGMDPDRIVEAAVSKGVISREEGGRLSAREALLLTCAPGFSTAEKVTDVSGRGVGMDAVKTAVEGLGGVLSIESEAGSGSTIILKLPRSVAIINVLLIRCGDMTVGIPISRVLRILELTPGEMERSGDRMTAPGEDSLPLYSLREYFQLPELPERPFTPVVVVDLPGGRGGLVVDSLAGQQEVFVKPIGRPLESVRGLAGGAVLGDGRGIFIIDAGAFL